MIFGKLGKQESVPIRKRGKDKLLFAFSSLPYSICNSCPEFLIFWNTSRSIYAKDSLTVPAYVLSTTTCRTVLATKRVQNQPTQRISTVRSQIKSEREINNSSGNRLGDIIGQTHPTIITKI